MVKQIKDEKTNNNQHNNLHTKDYFTNVGKHCTKLTPQVFSGVRVAHLLSFSVLEFFFIAMCLVYPMLPMSLDCPFLIAPSVF
jgi:hypothetical protein